MYQIKEIQAKTILSKCNITGIDNSINPYIGCRFGCIYCYASFMGRFVNKKIEEWGSYVFVKTNAPQLLEKELKKIKNNGKDKVIWFSSVTDPYQGVEVKYQLTRQCLQILVNYQFQGLVSVLTKSDLILRDLDLYKKLPSAELGLTITTTSDKISRFFEKHAPPINSRFKALKIINQNKLTSYAFIGPLFPHIINDAKQLDSLFNKIQDTGTKNVYVEYFNPSQYIVNRLREEIKANNKTISLYLQSKNIKVRQQWDKKVMKLVKKYRLKLLSGSTIYHLDKK